MIEIKVSPILVKKIRKTFKNKSKEIFRWMRKLRETPHAGQLMASIGHIELRELKYENVFRFYFFTNKNLVKILDEDELQLILIKFVEISKKGKEQQKIIDKLKKDLKKYGFDWF